VITNEGDARDSRKDARPRRAEDTVRVGRPEIRRVGAIYKIRELIDFFITLAFSCQCQRPVAECRAILTALQAIPVHLRTIQDQDGPADAGVSLLRQRKTTNDVSSQTSSPGRR